MSEVERRPSDQTMPWQYREQLAKIDQGREIADRQFDAHADHARHKASTIIKHDIGMTAESIEGILEIDSQIGRGTIANSDAEFLCRQLQLDLAVRMRQAAQEFDEYLRRYAR